MQTFGIVGFPLLQSFSEIYFEEKFVKENIKNAAFKLFLTPAIEELPAMLSLEQCLQGFCITIPHKKNILPYLSVASGEVVQMGACNCVRVKDGKWYGYNTDTIGFEKSFTPHLQSYHTNALILGTGGVAAAVAFALEKLHIPYQFVSRNNTSDSLTYAELTSAIIAQHLIIINCTPLGMIPCIDTCVDIPYQYLTPKHYLYDVVYKPTKTKFLSNGAAQGAFIKNGYDMLILQAEENWKIWNE